MRNATMGDFGAEGCRFGSVQSYINVRNTAGGWKTYKGRVLVYIYEL